ncbi:MAG: HAD family hydrolase [Candidatus Hodarchaeota archaeon]
MLVTHKISKRRLVLFDFDGTLVDSMRVATALLWKKVNRASKTKMPFKIFQKHIQKTMQFVWAPENTIYGGLFLFLYQVFLLARGIGLGIIGSFKLTTETFILTIKSYDPKNLFPDVDLAIARLKFSRFLVGIYTLAPKRFVQLTFRQRLTDFDVVITRNDIRKRKPHPQGVIEALNRLGVDPNNCFVVGDLPLDIMAANKAKVVSLGITTGLVSRSILEKFQPCAIFDSLEEITEYIINFASESIATN